MQVRRDMSILIFIWLLVILLVVWILLRVWINNRRRRGQRGFEVTLNTGEAPVPQEKENDHG
jgi:hypothetical protein